VDKICGIYMIENVVNHHIYIGSSKDIDGRVSGHFKHLDRCKHGNAHLQSAYNKYGKENFISTTLITCHLDVLLWYEQQFLDAWKPEYNKSGIAGRVEITEDVRKKLSEIRMGRKCPWVTQYKKGMRLSEEVKRRMSIAKIGNQYSKGKILSEDTRERISDSLKGRIFSAEHKRKIGLASKGNKIWEGRKHSEETKRKMSMAAMGKEKTEETRKKMSIAQIGNQKHKGKKLSDEAKKKISIAKIGKKYPNISKSKMGNKNCVGRKLSDETKRKISDAHIAYWENKRLDDG